jgi:hypothetical protein
VSGITDMSLKQGSANNLVESKSSWLELWLIQTCRLMRSAAKATAKDKFLARLLLSNADKRQYGELLRDIENDHTRNIGNYPDTPTAAFDLAARQLQTSKIAPHCR